jgi:DNA-binding NarL/FixJ family response regulator
MMPWIRQPAVFVRACIVGLASAGLGLVLALAGLKIWGFFVGAAALAPTVRWVTIPMGIGVHRRPQEVEPDSARRPPDPAVAGHWRVEKQIAAGIERGERHRGTSTPLRVLFWGNEPPVIRKALEADGIDVVGEATSRDLLFALVPRQQPNLVLLDLDMSDLSGHEGVAEIRRSWPEIRTVVLSAYDDRASIDSALVAGASAYLLKSVSPLDVPRVLRLATGLDPFIVPGAQASPAAAPQLTEREQAILRAVASGLTTKAISNDLSLSERTVKFHLTKIYRKLGVRDKRWEGRGVYYIGRAES